MSEKISLDSSDNDKLRLYNNLIHLKSFPPILLEKHYRPTTGNSICSTHPCNYRN